MTVSIHQTNTHLSRLIQQVKLGEEVVVCRGKLPLARIVPSGPSRIFLPKAGKATSQRFDITDDVFAPLGDEELKQWDL